jgi:hypothetical protein
MVRVDERRLYREQKEELAAPNQNRGGQNDSRSRGVPRVSSRQASVGLLSRPLCSNVSRVPNETPLEQARAGVDPELQQEQPQQQPNEEEEDSLSTQQRVLTLEAIRVDSEKNMGLATAEKDSFLASLRRSNLAQCSICLCCFLIVGLVVGLSMAFTKDSSDDGSDHDKFFDSVGPPLDGKASGLQYGSSISMSRDGTRMAVADSKDVYVYDLLFDENVEEHGQADWVLVTTIEAPEDAILDAGHNDLFLASVVVDLSRSGSSLAIGWPYSANKEGLEPGTGRVEVYQDPGDGSTQWQRVGNAMYGWEGVDFFGTSVALGADGHQVAIGSPGNDGNAAVYMLLNQGIWLVMGDTIHLSGELSVTSVAFKGQTLAIAGQTSAPHDGAAQPVARIYRFIGLDWVELGVGLHGVFKNIAYLVEISSDGNIVALSNYYTAPWQGELNDALDIRVYEWDGSEWVQMGEKLHGFTPGEKSGYFITLSDDGKSMGMGDPGRQSEGGGSVAGHIHLYKFDDMSQLWIQIGPNRDGDATGDQFGRAVALSGDGKYLAAGAPFNRGEGVELGRVYVFAIDPADVRSGSSSEDGWS